MTPRVFGWVLGLGLVVSACGGEDGPGPHEDAGAQDAAPADAGDGGEPGSDAGTADAGPDAGSGVCGNGVIEGTEGCDDGNSEDGDGCDTDCTPSCATDAECPAIDSCHGPGTCDAPTRTCAPGPALAEGTGCGSGLVCRGGLCLEAFCGDGVVSAPEECEDGNTADGDGCDNDCSFSCTADAGCDDGDACNGAEGCDPTARRCTPGTVPGDGADCELDGMPATRDLCIRGACRRSACGDRFVDASRGEACDDGNATDGDGCDSDCSLSCAGAASCDDGNDCNGIEACSAAHVCSPGSPPAGGTDCVLGAGSGVCRGTCCRTPVCGDGVIDGGEPCDDGNGIAGDGCDSDCTFSCDSDAECADANICNGTERCDPATHRCRAGTPAPAGTSCGTLQACRGGSCAGATCGTGLVEPGEQCDDANTVDGDGCDNDCTFSCTADAQCDDARSCNGTERCNTTTHRCTPGTSAADGTACGTGRICRAGDCRVSRCGDGVRDPARGETCDDGNDAPGDGCECDCSFSCTADDECRDADPCNGAERCDAGAHTCMPGSALSDGTACTLGGGVAARCLGARCRVPFCGDGFVDAGEDCDDGNDLPADGCEPGCRAICSGDAACLDGNVCDGTETCRDGRCAEGTALTDGTVCDADAMPMTRDLCRGGACRRSVCGDGFVDAGRGETCEPPAAGCDPRTCTAAPVASCGDGAVGAGEDCDDGTPAAWDGCSATCRLEQTVRADRLVQEPATRGCDLDGDGTVDNAFGAAFTDFARSQFDMGAAMEIDSGAANMLIHFLDLDDRLGRNDPAMRIALFEGTDAAPPFEGTRGEAFTIGRDQLDAAMQPITVLSPGSIVATALRAGPSTVGRMGGSFTLERAEIRGTVTADAVMRRIDALREAFLCGAIRASELDAVPASEMIPASCRAAPPEVSSLLDLFVSGCSLGVTALLDPTQPDISLDADGLAAGRILEDTDRDRIVDTCRDGRTATVIRGDDCAQDPRFDDAFSQALGLSGYRVVITAVTP